MEPFDAKKAKKKLEEKDRVLQEELEKKRAGLLEKACNVLKQYFKEKKVGVFLVGSILEPYKFNKRSDIDIVLKKFQGDRFEVWAELETLLDHKLELIIYESCHFKDHIDEKGYKVI